MVTFCQTKYVSYQKTVSLILSTIFILIFIVYNLRSQNTSVGVATGYVLDGRRSIISKGKRFLSSLQRPDRLLGTPSLPSNGYWGIFLRKQSGTGQEWRNYTSTLHTFLRHGSQQTKRGLLYFSYIISRTISIIKQTSYN